MGDSVGRVMRADIIIGGKLEGFDKIMACLNNLGDMLSAVGQSMTNNITRPLVSLGKEAVEKYVQFEDGMLEAEGALKTQYNTTSELGRAMDSLNDAALDWSRNSRFTTKDVSSAIAEAAHAGWNAEKILAGIPEAMKVSMDGGMELADGLQYLVDVVNAAGLSFDDLGDFTDKWAYSANRTSTTIPEMGQAMQRMGASMQFFKGDMAGLTTMLGILADNGTKGSAGGTLLRNTVMRLIAPTEKAADAMEGLDLTSEELAKIYEDSDGLEDAVKLLKEMGFTVYDTGGKLRSFTDIFKDLDLVTRNMTEEKRNKVLYSLFPTRTMSGALALLEAARDDYGGLYDDVKNKSAGYGEELSALMESGLGGTLRSLEASWDVLETKTGGVLADDVDKVAGGLEDIVNSIIDMDDTKLATIVGGLEGLAAVGPALLGVGAAMKVISTVSRLGPVGIAAVSITALAVGIGALRGAMQELEKQEFGEMEIDSEALGVSLDALAARFDGPRKKIEAYNEAIESALTNYDTASTQFSENLVNTFITGQTLGDTEINELQNLGDKMIGSIIDGAKASMRENTQTVEYLRQNTDVGDYTLWSDLLNMLNTGSQEVIDRANEIGKEIDEAITAAFSGDRKLDEKEFENIKKLLDEANELAIATSRASMQTQTERFLKDHQNISKDSMEEAVQLYTGQRDAQIAELENDRWNNIGEINKYAALHPGEEVEKYKVALNESYDQLVRDTKAEYDKYLIDTVYAGMLGSDFGGNLSGMINFADTWLMRGGNLTPEERRGYENVYDKQVSKYIEYLFNALGGEYEIPKTIESLRDSGLADAADILTQMKLLMDFGEYGQFVAPEEYYSDLYKSGQLTGYTGKESGSIIPHPMSGMEETASGGADEAMKSAMEEAAQNPITVSIEGDDEPLNSAITAHDGQSVTVNVQANMSAFMGAIASAKAALASLFGGGTEKASGGANANKPVAAMYAEGGRATVPSIFAEAGTPEWAIPEEHTDRTATLLREAARASGFGWGELLSGQTGGTSGTSLVYSPVIYATDTRGVRDELMEDKKRLEKWLREKNMIDRISVYA